MSHYHNGNGQIYKEAARSPARWRDKPVRPSRAAQVIVEPTPSPTKQPDSHKVTQDIRCDSCAETGHVKDTCRHIFSMVLSDDGQKLLRRLPDTRNLDVLGMNSKQFVNLKPYSIRVGKNWPPWNSRPGNSRYFPGWEIICFQSMWEIVGTNNFQNLYKHKELPMFPKVY